MSVTSALLDLARAKRGEDWAEEFRQSLLAAHHAGWSEERQILAAARLVVDPRASGRDLAHEARKATERAGGSPPNDGYRAVREAIGRRDG